MDTSHYHHPSPPISLSSQTANDHRNKEQTVIGGVEGHSNRYGTFCEIRDILIRNAEVFASKSAFLDALLVFVSYYSMSDYQK